MDIFYLLGSIFIGQSRNYMYHSKIFLIIFVPFLWTLEVPARTKKVHEYPLTLQWIDATPGKIIFSQVKKDEFSVRGWQKKDKDRLEMDGKLFILDKKTLQFDGRILTHVSYIAGGKECVRTGTFTFRKMGTRKYYRMKEMDNPCDGVVDYIDIFR
jgi:hypothetical protein